MLPWQALPILSFFFFFSSLLSCTFVLSSFPTDLYDIDVVISPQYLLHVNTSLFVCFVFLHTHLISNLSSIISNLTRPKSTLHRQNYLSGFLFERLHFKQRYEALSQRKAAFLSSAEMSCLFPLNPLPLFLPPTLTSPGPWSSWKFVPFLSPHFVLSIPSTFSPTLLTPRKFQSTPPFASQLQQQQRSSPLRCEVTCIFIPDSRGRNASHPIACPFLCTRWEREGDDEWCKEIHEEY